MMFICCLADAHAVPYARARPVLIGTLTLCIVSYVRQVEDEAKAVYNVLTTFENLIEVDTQVGRESGGAPCGENLILTLNLT